jgi:hypothetical protein
MAKGALLEMLGEKAPVPKLRLVGTTESAQYQRASEEGVKKPRLRPLERRKLAASQ